VIHAGLAVVIGAVFDLNHPAHVVHWHFIKLPLANVIAIGLMLVAFAIAIALPFPGAARRAAARRDGDVS
jgi:hypothetical protein